MTKTAATKFQVRWRKSDEPDTLWSSPVDVGKDGNVKVPGLERVQDYVFQARAGSECGAWSDWVVQTFNMPEAAAPEAVSSLTAQSVADGVHLAWASIIADGGTKFSIERSTAADSGFAERAQTNATAYTDPETSGSVFYYRVRAVNYRGSFGPYSNIVSSQGVAVDALGDDVAAAQTAADNAQHAADAANAQLADIANDGILSPGEKPAVIRDYDVITTEQAGIDGQATAYGITTEKTAYDNAISALTTYLNGLTSPVAWNDKSGNTTIVATTFKGNFTTVYAARQTLLNKIYATAKSLADTAATTANANTTLVQNPFFATGDLTGWTSDHGTYAFEKGTSGPLPGTSQYAKRVGNSSNPSDPLRNTGRIPVAQGSVVKGACNIRGISANGTAGVRISWRASNDSEISTSSNDSTLTGTFNYGATIVGTAPAGAVWAHVEGSVKNHTAGTYTFDNFAASLLTDTLDQVADSATRYAASEAGADKTSGKPLSSLSGRTMDYIGDSATRFAAAESGADKTAGKSLTVLSDRTLGNIADDATYIRTIQQSQAEAVDNAGFEAASTLPPPGWLVNGLTVSYDTGAPYAGSQSLILSASAQYQSLTSARIYQCSPGQRYFATIAATGEATGAWAFGFRGSDGSTHVVSIPPQSPGWNQYQTSWTVGAGITSFQIIYYRDTASASNICEIDSITLARVRSLDLEIADGTTYGRLANSDLYSSGGVNRLGLRVAGSGHTVGDQRNLLLQTWGGMRSVLSNSPISFSISGTTVNFSIAAVTLQGAGTNLPYAASSGSVTQAAGTTTTYFLYYIDNAQAGGSLPLNITTNPGGPASWPNGVLLGTASVTVASGGGGSSGTGGGGGGYCVADNMYIGEGRLAGNAEIGDSFDCIDLPTSAGKHVRALQGVSRGMEECVRMITSDGCALVCSVSTPFDLPDGRNTTAPRMLGEQVITDLGIATVTSLALVGQRSVTRAHLGGVSYAAGADPHRRIYSHNISGPKP